VVLGITPSLASVTPGLMSVTPGLMSVTPSLLVIWAESFEVVLTAGAIL
jgi:hypothetical protein